MEPLGKLLKPQSKALKLLHHVTGIGVALNPKTLLYTVQINPKPKAPNLKTHISPISPKPPNPKTLIISPINPKLQNSQARVPQAL